MNTETLSPAPAVATSNACLSLGFKIGAGEPLSATRLVSLYEEAQGRAFQLFTRLKHDRSNERLMVRYVRSLRRCERLQARLADLLHA
jgi:hypothetical protein